MYDLVSLINLLVRKSKNSIKDILKGHLVIYFQNIQNKMFEKYNIYKIEILYQWRCRDLDI